MNFTSQTWQELIDTLDAVIFVTDEKRQVRFANQAARAITSQRTLDVVGARLDKVLSELKVMFDRADAVVSGETAWQPLVIELPDGAGPLFHAKVTRRESRGSGPGDYVILLQRITEELKAGLNPKRSVSALMPTFLHELKNPLAAISTSVELLLEDLEPSELRDELAAIFGEVRRMKLVLDGVGLVGKPLRERGRLNVQRSLREACTVLHPLAKRKGINFKAFIADSEPLPFNTMVLKAIVFNLVMNAIHACNEGQTISVRSVIESGIFVLEVKDNGMGMNQETLEQCTRLFYTTKSFGSGIGLALCQEVASEAGGELLIDSAEGVGTTVTFRVPIDRRTGTRT